MGPFAWRAQVPWHQGAPTAQPSPRVATPSRAVAQPSPHVAAACLRLSARVCLPAFLAQYADIVIRTSVAGGDDDSVSAFPLTLYRIKEGGGVSRVMRVKSQPINRGSQAEGSMSIGPRPKIPVSKLKSPNVYLIDTGFEIFLWTGKDAPRSLRGQAFPNAQKYLKSYKRPPVLPMHEGKEGKEPENLKAFLGPAEEEPCCGCGCVVA